jgi:hypothetical protein
MITVEKLHALGFVKNELGRWEKLGFQLKQTPDKQWHYKAAHMPEFLMLYGMVDLFSLFINHTGKNLNYIPE